MIDPRYWSTIMSYLRDAGVTTFEQDWLSAFAKTNFDLQIRMRSSITWLTLPRGTG
jgi:hypothetical protein